MNRVNFAFTKTQAEKFLEEFVKIWNEVVKTPGKTQNETKPVAMMGFQEDSVGRDKPKWFAFHQKESKVSDGPRYVWEPSMSSSMWLVVQSTPKLRALMDKGVFV